MPAVLMSIFLCFSVVCRGQPDVYWGKADSPYHFTFQFVVSTDAKALYLNIVGGGARLVRGRESISLIVFPTLRFGQIPAGVTEKPFVTPGFSIGLLFQRKQFLVGIPVYYGLDSRWHVTGGIGLKFGR